MKDIVIFKCAKPVGIEKSEELISAKVVDGAYPKVLCINESGEMCFEPMNNRESKNSPKDGEVDLLKKQCEDMNTTIESLKKTIGELDVKIKEMGRVTPKK